MFTIRAEIRDSSGGEKYRLFTAERIYVESETGRTAAIGHERTVHLLDAVNNESETLPVGLDPLLYFQCVYVTNEQGKTVDKIAAYG